MSNPTSVNDPDIGPDDGCHNESVHDLILHGRPSRISGVNYHFGSGESPVAGPLRQPSRHRPRRGGDHDRAVGLGQDDAPDPDRRPADGAGGGPPRQRPRARRRSRRRPVAHRRQIGFIFQHHNLFSSLSAIENVRWRPPCARRRCRRRGRARREILDRLGLGDRAITPAGRLSGGQRQRVAIARRWSTAPCSCSPTSRRPRSTPPRARS